MALLMSKTKDTICREMQDRKLRGRNRKQKQRMKEIRLLVWKKRSCAAKNQIILKHRPWHNYDVSCLPFLGQSTYKS